MKWIVIFLLVIPVLAYGQGEANFKVKGAIRNARTGEPVPNAHVRLPNQGLGVSANEEGMFSLMMDESFKNQSLVFSCIGYKNKTVKIQDILNNEIIQLQDTVITLKNVVITAVDPEAVIRSAIRKSATNYAENPYHLKAFYRTSFKENDSFVRLFEAAVTIADKGFDQSGGYQAVVTQYRKSNDYRQIKWRQGSNFLFNYLKKDNIRNRRFFLNKKLVKNYHYSLGGITEFDGREIYWIKVSLKDSSSVSYKANVYLRSKDHAVVAIDDATIIKRPKPYGLSDSLRIAFTGGETQVKYVEVDGKLYLSYSSALSRHDAFDTEGNTKGTLDMYEEMVVYDTAPIAYKTQGKVKKGGDIYLADYPYDEAFWQSFNVPVDTEHSLRIKYDLDKKEDLEVQFKKNGGTIGQE